MRLNLPLQTLENIRDWLQSYVESDCCDDDIRAQVQEVIEKLTEKMDHGT